jgi:diguanylate cyclase (GGDEF)-like protein
VITRSLTTPRRARRGGRRPLVTSPLAVGILGALVACAAGIAIVSLAGAADESRRSQLALADIEIASVRQRALVTQAAQGGVTDDLRSSLDAVGRSFDAAVAETARAYPGDTEVAKALDAALDYRHVVDEELALVAAGRAGAAEVIDRRLAGPSYERFRLAIDTARDRAETRAEDAAALARGGTFAILALAAGLLVWLLWRFDHARRIAHEAFYDSLTGLANRTLFADRLDHALALAGRREEALAVLFLDLDDFKVVNDTLGHGAGDDLLVEVAERLVSQTRVSDTVARLGGDEFAFLLEATTEEGARRFAHRITDALGSPFVIAGRTLSVRATVGYAIGARGDDEAEELLRNADLAMYSGKRQGKGRVVGYEPSMYQALADRLELEADLRGALDRGELALVYQPIVDVETSRLMSVEALARWNHPSRGVVPPTVFIPIAEETGLIRDIGRWALVEACQRAAGWQSTDAAIGVGVNVSPAQFLHGELVRDVRAALSRSGLDPVLLTLEITESVLVERGEAFLEELEALSALGVRIAVDDFGTGYSSLSSLGRFPVDVVKIDRSFIVDLEGDPDAHALVRSIVDLGHSLGLVAVAEGIEQSEQADVLQGAGCGLAQGFHYAKPMEADEVTQLLADRGEPERASQDAPATPLRPPSPPVSPQRLRRAI